MADDPDNPDDKSWPPSGYSAENAQLWLRYQVQFPGSDAPSRLVAHSNAPYRATRDGVPDEESLGKIASAYLAALEKLLSEINETQFPQLPDKDRLLPNGWLEELTETEEPSDVFIRWLPVWPVVGGGDVPKPRLASWNLSRKADRGLPATIVLAAAELVDPVNAIGNYQFGIRIPMQVRSTDTGFAVTIRSMTAELPHGDEISNSEAAHVDQMRPRDSVISLVERLSSPELLSTAVVTISDAASLDADTVLTEGFRFVKPDDDSSSVGIQAGFRLRYSVLGRSRLKRTPQPLTYRTDADFEFSPGTFDAKLTKVVSCPMYSHAAEGSARIFRQTPPGWFGSQAPDDAYDWSMRRPSRPDPILDRDRVGRGIGPGADVELEGKGYVVRNCPWYVRGDVAGPDAKVVNLPDGNDLQPRRNDFSAVSAFYNSRRFFRYFRWFGIDPHEFTVRAQPDIQVFYRYGISPGPGKTGRVVNAQVSYDCKDRNALPEIRMHLALANLNRWSRPKHVDPATGKTYRSWAEPLGIATSGRWMAHEYGHYLLAARLGRLEFAFAHSPGDAMAAVMFDPFSRLADTRGGVSAKFRGYTYPFVFAPRRHDRTPLLGWGWYGYLNRSILKAPAVACDKFKGYETEQILSSTLFRLYRSLGGDTMAGDEPQRWVRLRASRMVIYLLIKAIESLTVSPTMAEHLERALVDIAENAAPPLPLPRAGTGQLRSGTLQKVVRWAFEAQGMFPADETKVLNGPGQPPPVDIFVEDRRPTEEMTEAGPIQYGKGSYVPVSLDWSADAKWISGAAWPPMLNNRGANDAPLVTLRGWVGTVQGPIGGAGWSWDARQIDWEKEFAAPNPFALPAKASVDPGINLPADIAAVYDNPGADRIAVLLIEISTADDKANTDPTMDYDVAITSGDPNWKDQMPQKTRSLVDLVASDNNLGLLVNRG